MALRGIAEKDFASWCQCASLSASWWLLQRPVPMTPVILSVPSYATHAVSSSIHVCSSTQLLQRWEPPQCPAPTVHVSLVADLSSTWQPGSFPQHVLSASFAVVCLQWEISPWTAFPGSVEGGFPASHRGHISRKFPHEASWQLHYLVILGHALSNLVWTSVLSAGRRASF